MNSLLKRRDATVLNLKDAGCSPDFIGKFMALAEQGKTEMLFTMLAAQKEALLQAAHESNHRIDCLDYLTYKMKKEWKQNGKDRES